MSMAIITPMNLCGEVDIPPSKSYAHRAIICAFLAKGISEIHPIDLSNDVCATIKAVEALGAKTKLIGKKLIVDSSEIFNIKQSKINCYECGAALRFFVPIVAALGITTRFLEGETLKKRPMDLYFNSLPKFGVKLERTSQYPLEVSGQLVGGIFELQANISSQFISGMLLALPLLKEDSEIHISAPIVSSSYIDMTIKTMSSFGVKILRTSYGFFVPGRQNYKPQNYQVEGDWSQAAFFIAAGILSGPITIHGLNQDSIQADKIATKLFSRMGADLRFEGEDLIIEKSELEAATLHASSFPDLVPILAVSAAFAHGRTSILGAQALRFKESNRLGAIQQNLSKLNVDIKEMDDGLLIKGQEFINGGKVEGFNDHRIVMSMAIAAIKAKDKISIMQANSISKSYPSFFEDYQKLGGLVDVFDV